MKGIYWVVASSTQAKTAKAHCLLLFLPPTIIVSQAYPLVKLILILEVFSLGSQGERWGVQVMGHPRWPRIKAFLESRTLNAETRTVLGKPKWLLILGVVTNMK